ncbi:Glutathione S-transferase kappa 1 [Actinomortierella ambigua]|nr:Glutathione S-transferase kappa 1 [Actinomortierella ambigua]
MAARSSVTLYFDVVSPYTYVGWNLLKRQRPNWRSVDFAFKPVLLGGIMNATKNTPNIAVPAKGDYMWYEIELLSSVGKFPYVKPSQFPFKTLSAMRVLLAVQRNASDKLEACADQQAAWAQGKDVGSTDVIIEQLAPVFGGSKEKVQQLIDLTADQSIKQSLIDNTNEAVKKGAFGGPFWVVRKAGSDKEHILFGSDRLETIAALLGEPYNSYAGAKL